MGAAPSLDDYLFLPPLPRYTDKADQFVRTAPGHGAYLVEHVPGASRNRGVILYFHANACDCGSAFSEEIRLAFRTRMSVLAVEYPGYGALGGGGGQKPSIEGANEAARHGFRYANEVLKVHPSRIFFFARSIGTGIAMDLARILVGQGIQIGATILVSPFFSLRRLVKEKIEEYATGVGSLVPINYIMPDECAWDNGSVMSKLKCPVLIIHGHQDKIVPIDHAYGLVEINPFAQGVFAAEWGHEMGCPDILSMIVSRTEDFLDEIFATYPPVSSRSKSGLIIDAAGREYVRDSDEHPIENEIRRYSDESKSREDTEGSGNYEYDMNVSEFYAEVAEEY